MRNHPALGIQIPHILLPKPGVDLSRWAVIACDQFSSEPEYWREVEKITSSTPSTFHMILPEVMLGTPSEAPRIESTQQKMREYLETGLFASREGLILVERHALGKTRRGVMLALDLEKYDYQKGSRTLIRATEGTIIERLPPRIRIREGAPLELPHILVLIDDPGRTVIEPLFDRARELPIAYDFDLMLGSGHLTGYHVNQEPLEQQLILKLEALADPARFRERYDLADEEPVLLFAMGDGNHSFATAKAIWEKMKGSVPPDHPARYALVEIENVHNEGLEFEPIHRVLFSIREPLRQALTRRLGGEFEIRSVDSFEDIQQILADESETAQRVGCVDAAGWNLVTFRNPSSNLAVGSLQTFLDAWQEEGGFEKIDYVHGTDPVARLGAREGNLGFFLPSMKKTDLFKTVILDGALPRKTFSMGEAKEKRFYLECRRIT